MSWVDDIGEQAEKYCRRILLERVTLEKVHFQDIIHVQTWKAGEAFSIFDQDV